jgi:amino acid transporter
VLKVVGLGAILTVGLLYHNPDASWGPLWPEANQIQWLPLAVPLILILYAYGGWNDAAFVAAEVRDVRRNLTRALFLGIFIITALYVLVNAAYINALGYDKAKVSRQVAADVLKLPLGDFGERAMSLLVMISALGAVNGLIFAGSRVYSTLGRDHAVFNWMGRWSNARGTPTMALIVQAVFCMAMIVLVGTPWGQGVIRQLLQAPLSKMGVAMADELWKPNDGFDYLFACSAPVFWTFFLLTGLSLFVLRFREPQVERPFRVPLYPVIPAIFCLSCAFWIYRSLEYVIEGKKATGGFLLIGVLPLLIGLPLYGLSWLFQEGSKKPAG